MLTLASILLLSQFRIGSRWVTWPFALGLALSGFMVQLVTVTRWTDIRGAGYVVGCLAVVTLLIRRWRTLTSPMDFWVSAGKDEISKTFDYLIKGGWVGRLVLAFICLVALSLVLFETLYLPIPIDDYNAIHAELIARHGNLFTGPVLNWAITGLGFFHEYLVADLSLVPGAGGVLVQLLPAFSWGAFAFAVFGFARRHDPERRLLWAWAAIAGLPMIIWSEASIYKNDLLVAALCFPALFVLSRRDNVTNHETQLQIGVFAGLAVAAKLSAAVIPMVVFLFLPVRKFSDFLESRIVFGIGLMTGAVCGGLFFVFWTNWVQFSNPLGLMFETHLLTGGAGDRVSGFLAFLNSVFNPEEVVLRPFNAIPAFLTPLELGEPLSFSRLSLSAVFAISLLGYGYQFARHRAKSWPGIIALSVIFMTAALDRDLNIAHRYIIAPGILLLLEAMRALGRGADDVWGRVLKVLVSVVALFVLLQSLLTIGTLFDKAEFLRYPESEYGRILIRIENSVRFDALRSNPIREKYIYMRRINDAARVAHHVANGAYEYFLALQGIDYEQILKLDPRSRTRGEPTWSLDEIGKFDLIILDPTEFPPPPALEKRLRSDCSLLQPLPSVELVAPPHLRAYQCQSVETSVP